MGEKEINSDDSWFKDGLELIPLGTRLDACARFLCGLAKSHGSEPESGAEQLLSKLLEEDISGMGYDTEEPM